MASFHSVNLHFQPDINIDSLNGIQKDEMDFMAKKETSPCVTRFSFEDVPWSVDAWFIRCPKWRIFRSHIPKGQWTSNRDRNVTWVTLDCASNSATRVCFHLWSRLANKAERSRLTQISLGNPQISILFSAEHWKSTRKKIYSQSLRIAWKLMQKLSFS